MRSPVDLDDLPYLLGLLGYGLFVAWVAMLSIPAALIVSGCLLITWAVWRVRSKRGQG